MPFDQVMHKFGKGGLHSGGPKGPVVKNQKQAVAIMLSEKKKAQGGDAEYAAEDQGENEPTETKAKSKKKPSLAALKFAAK